MIVSESDSGPARFLTIGTEIIDSFWSYIVQVLSHPDVVRRNISTLDMRFPAVHVDTVVNRCVVLGIYTVHLPVYSSLQFIILQSPRTVPFMLFSRDVLCGTQ